MLPGWLDAGSGITVVAENPLNNHGIGPRDLVIRVRGAILNAGDQTRASGTALTSRLSREVRLPGWLDPGSDCLKDFP